LPDAGQPLTRESPLEILKRVDQTALPPPVRIRVQDVAGRLQASQRDANAMALLASLLYVYGSPADAAACMRSALEIDAQVPSWRYQYGLCLEKAGRTQEAVGEYEEFIAASRDELQRPAFTRLGLILADSDRQRAISFLEKAVKLAPHDVHAQLGLARLKKQGGDSAAALDHALRAAKTAPLYAAARAEAIEQLRAAGRAAEASELERIRIDVEPLADDVSLTDFMTSGMDPHYAIHISLAAVERGDFAKAERGLLVALELDAKGSFAHLAMGILRRQQGRGDEALAFFRTALANDPGDALCRSQMGQVLYQLKREEEAVPELRAALESNPQDVAARFLYANWLMGQNKLAEARLEYVYLIENATPAAEPYAALSQIAAMEKDKTEARRWLREGMARVPDAHALASALAWLLATDPDPNVRDGGEAVKLAQRASDATRPAKHEYLDTLAAAFAEAGKFQAAVDAESRALLLCQDQSISEEVRRGYRERLALYKRSQPYRERE
jgi:tetratricopeptide (TPR) repeat protein